MGAQAKRSVLVVAVVLVVAALAWGVQQLAAEQAGDRGGLVAKVTVDGQVRGTYDLSQPARHVIETPEGVNTVVVADGGVRIEDADCKGGDCMAQGTITAAGQLLVCLPHKLIVEIVPAGDAGAPSVYDGGPVGAAGGEADSPDRLDTVAR